MDEITEFLSSTAVAVERELERLLPVNTGAASVLRDAMRWSLFGGGKRFRPALVFASGRAFGASDKHLVGTAAAVEMIHTYSLIHDDLPSMDDDDLRRGRFTCHKKYGEATAILAGDALQAFAFKVLADDELISSGLRLQLLSTLGAAAKAMVAGQFMDLKAEGTSPTLEEVQQIHLNKTGALIEFSAVSGALIAGASGSELAAVRVYAAKLGLLFQVTDDILDATQTSDELGKTAGKDAASKKATYVAKLGIEGSKQLAMEIAEQASSAVRGSAFDTHLLAELPPYLVNRGS